MTISDMASKRSLLDLLPQPTQRQTNAPSKRPKKKEANGAEEEEEKKTFEDNELYRVNLSAAEPTLTPVPVPPTPAIPPAPPAQKAEKRSPRKESSPSTADALIMKAFEEEQTRGRKGGKGKTEIEFKEISQDELKSGVSTVQREVDAIGLALKADEDEDDKVVLPQYTLSKEAHRKHQITTLFQTMKKNETKMMTKDAQNAKTKRETERKYGWR